MVYNMHLDALEKVAVSAIAQQQQLSSELTHHYNNEKCLFAQDDYQEAFGDSRPSPLRAMRRRDV